MFENSEKLSEINLKDVFNVMLSELPWEALKDFIQANSQVKKVCMAGGHRLDKKRRRRFEKIIIREAEKKGFEGDICSSLFAYWYPAQDKLHKALEEYFESEDYKAYREERGLEEHEYALPDEVFNSLYQVKNLQKWRVLLCFSPLQFNDAQVDLILQEAGGKTEEMLQQVYEIQEEAESYKKEKNRLVNENADLRKRLEELGAEDHEIRSERKLLRAERDSLQNKLESAKTDNQRLRDELAEVEKKRELRLQEAMREAQLEKKRLLAELDQLKKELETWKSKYEIQRNEVKDSEQQIKITEKALAAERVGKKNVDRKLREVEAFADAVLSRINWTSIAREMKPTPQLKRKLNSLIKSLDYEEDRTLKLDENLIAFWDKFQKQEKDLVFAIAESDTREVKAGDVEEYWNNLTDSFEDVVIGLEARTIILQALKEIFYQTLTMENLEEAALPGNVKGNKKVRDSRKNKSTTAVA